MELTRELTQPRLTSLSHGAGCGCKLSAADLLPLLSRLPAPQDPRLLVGSSTGDDAAVFALSPDLALVQTVDFFTPIVDDPFDFGRIAAANALSDVYAMGGTPLLALNLVAFPLEQLGGEILARILEGGHAVATKAGCVLVGGHSIDDPEPKYGLSVTGTVAPDRLLTNAGARPGDTLVLTKPLGAGAITTASKRGAATARQLAEAVETMATLNERAGRQALAAGAHAATDVTGFGLLGHLRSITRESGVSAQVRAVAVPALDGALELLAGDDGVSGPEVDRPRQRLLCDPMTSGGLLIAVADERAAEIDGARIGVITPGQPGAIDVV